MGATQVAISSFWTKAPATPFAPEAFDPRSPHHTYAGEWLPAAQAAIGPRREAPPFLGTGGEPKPIDVVSLDDLLAWLRDPPKDYCRRVLELSLPESHESEDDEPFAQTGLDGYKLCDALLRRLAERPAADDAWLAQCVRAEGLVRPGRLGDADARNAIATARRLLALRRERFGAAQPESRLVEREVEGRLLVGRIDDVVDGLPVRLRAGGARGPDWLQLALSAKLLGAESAWFFGREKGDAIVKTLDATLVPDTLVAEVVGLYVRARAEFQPLTRIASWEYACAASKGPDAAEKVAALAFAPTFRQEGRPVDIDNPHVALLFRGRVRNAIDDDFATVALDVYGAVAGAVSDA
ncbi:MAG TPA: hypothetical protein VFL14_00220 [Xanthomonadales bacterium]|nr:hypothetical protein [Xanthomonadales bacterium]